MPVPDGRVQQIALLLLVHMAAPDFVPHLAVCNTDKCEHGELKTVFELFTV